MESQSFCPKIKILPTEKFHIIIITILYYIISYYSNNSVEINNSKATEYHWKTGIKTFWLHTP